MIEEKAAGGRFLIKFLDIPISKNYISLKVTEIRFE